MDPRVCSLVILARRVIASMKPFICIPSANTKQMSKSRPISESGLMAITTTITPKSPTTTIAKIATIATISTITQ